MNINSIHSFKDLHSLFKVIKKCSQPQHREKEQFKAGGLPLIMPTIFILPLSTTVKLSERPLIKFINAKICIPPTYRLTTAGFSDKFIIMEIKRSTIHFYLFYHISN